MGYIYKITNQINGKAYIGKTLLTVEKRWQQHLNDALRNKNENRPLYKAIKKYGKENFIVTQIEECSEKEINDREQYWIEYYSTYSKGYNATLGGDGVHYLNYDEICEYYLQLRSLKDVAKQLNISTDSVRKALQNNNIHIYTSNEIRTLKGEYKVKMYDKNETFLKEFSSQSEAARWLKEQDSTITANISTISCNIGRCIKGERHTAYKYKWSK